MRGAEAQDAAVALPEHLAAALRRAGAARPDADAASPTPTPTPTAGA